MGKIGDLWVRLGLRKQDFDKGMKDAEKNVGGLGRTLSGLKAAAAGAFAAIAAAATSAFVNVALESNKLGDKWREVVGGMQNVWNTFVNSLLNDDWKGFWTRIQNGFESGKTLARASDALTEQMNSLKMRRADLEQENARLRVEMQDQNKSYEERAAAAKKYLENVEPLYEEEAGVLRRYLKDMENAWLQAANLDTNSAMQAMLEKFLKNGAKLDENMARIPEYVQISKMYEAMGDTINNQLVGAYVNAKNAAGAFEAENRRVFSSFNMATAQIAGGASSTSGTTNNGNSDAAKAAWKAGRDRAKQIQQQAEDSLKSEETLLAEHYERDKKLLQKYHLDTKALDEKYENDRLALIIEGLELEEDELEEIVDEPLEFPPVDTSNLEAFLQKWDEGVARAQELKDEFIQSVVGGFSDGIQELTDQLFGLQDVNPGRILQALLTPLADMAVREGEILMAQGLGVEAVKKSLESLDGVAAIVAGASLITIGAATKSGLAALAKGGSGTTTQSYSGGSTNGTNGGVIRSELVVRVEGTLKGSDIVLSGTNTQKSWNR